MTVKIETPPSGTGSPQQQLTVLYSYLHRTAQQLQWAFDMLEPGRNSGSVQNLVRGGGSREEKQEALTPEEKFSEIKNLIIRSADIVEIFSEKIRKTLDGEYLAVSEFGTYQEKTRQELAADSRGIQQLYTYNASIRQDLNDLKAETASTRAYIRTGCLQEGTFPVYGLEIGQRNVLNGQEVFRKYARFTADRLSFFDAGDLEVAYVSDYKLYITNAQVAGELSIGSRFRVNFDGGLIFKWTGGEN